MTWNNDFYSLFSYKNKLQACFYTANLSILYRIYSCTVIRIFSTWLYYIGEKSKRWLKRCSQHNFIDWNHVFNYLHQWFIYNKIKHTETLLYYTNVQSCVRNSTFLWRNHLLFTKTLRSHLDNLTASWFS